MKTLSYLLAAALLTTACSTSSSTTDSASTGGSTPIDASSSNAASSSATGTSGTSGTGTEVVGGSGGSIVSSTGTATSSGSATDIASDLTAFAGTFATMDDPTFMLTAASSNMLEVQMGQLAAQKSTNANVKQFGQMMVDHHGKATQNWKAVATPLGISMPTALMPVHQTMYDQVMKKSGKDFDEAYMDAMETAHKLDIAMFEVKSKGAQTPAVQSFASKNLPMLRSHSTMASELEKKVD
ncbi:hypothetical protein GCM10027048_25900 [Hymenobacter coalescens]